MKEKSIKLIIIIASTLVLIGCGGSDNNRKGFDSPRNRYGNNNQGYTSDRNLNTLNVSNFRSCQPTNELPGIIAVNAQYSNDFSLALEAFLSGVGEDPLTFLGHVDGGCGADTGVGFNAYIDTLDPIDPFGQNYTEVQASSALQIKVIDSFAKTGDYDPITITADKGAYGYINGSYAEIEFEWGDQNNNINGIITLSGSINPSTEIFSGTVSFDNFIHFDGGSGYNGTLGDFEVRVCDIFQCY